MPIKKASSKGAVVGTNGSHDVDQFMSKSEHPLKAEIEAVRGIILGADKTYQAALGRLHRSVGYIGRKLRAI